MDMHGFYENVIKDFGKRLYDNLASKEQELDSERIDAMKNVLYFRYLVDSKKNGKPKTII